MGRHRPKAGALGGAVLWALLALACNRVDTAAGPGARGTSALPSVLLVTIDTLRADHVGAYGAGFAHTPTLDGLAARGLRFETVIAPAPITLPSHASLFTATRPPRHGVRHNGTFRLGETLPTLAERFRAAGHATGAVVGSVVLLRRHGLDRGFGHYDDRIGGRRRAGTAGYAERTATEVSDAALRWLAEHGGGPFLLWVHYYDPHQEHRAPPAFARRFPDRPYDAEVAYVDHELGRLLGTLADRGRLRDTLVAVTSDHGESLGEHGEASHGMTLYDAALRVPWLLAGPGVPEGRVVSGIARTIDVAPTLLSMAGLDPLPGADGEDLSPFLDAETLGAERWAYAETLLPALDYGWAPLHALRASDRLYVRAPRPELYDLADDPGQREDRSGRPGAAETMAALDERVEAILAASGASARVALEPEERERLRALGYALPDAPVAATGLDPKDGLRHERLIRQAARAVASERYAEAEAALRAFLEHAPESPRAHGLLASVLLYTDRAASALEHADRAIALDPRPVHRFTQRAEIRAVLGDATGARRDFERAAAIDPEDPNAQAGMTWVRVREGDLPGAAAHARRAFTLAPQSASVRFRIGLIWLEAHAYRAALESFRDTVRLRPDFAPAHARLAIEYARVGRTDLAREHRKRAGSLVHEPRMGVALARALAAAGDLEAGEALLQELERRHPGDTRVADARPDGA